MNNFSRIDTDYDESNESDSSIQENVTYQALQKIRFPGSMKLTNPMSRDASPDRGEDVAVTAPRMTARKSRIAVGLGAIGFMSSLTGDVNLSQVIEFFDPIKQRNALSKKKSTGKIKDKGST